MSSETKFIILLILEKISEKYPHIMRDKYQAFFVINLEKKLI